MGRLVGVIARGTPAFVDVLRRTWDAGDAVLPVDPRLPEPARAALVQSARPACVIDPASPDGPAVAEDPGAPPVGPMDALVIATSGTTGHPKLAIHTHDGLAAHARAVHERLEVDPSDRWLACLPLGHIGGLGVVIRALLDGTPLDVTDGFDAAAVQVAAASGATLTSLVPTAADRVDLSGFRCVLIGGAADPASERPPNVIRTWGLTETCGGIVYDGHPLPGVEVIAIHDELWVRSFSLARGLRLANGSVAELRSVHPDDAASTGWLATGDHGFVGPGGIVTCLGRTHDVIVTGGENVHPGPVEAVLLRHPSVAEVAVSGQDHPEWGQSVEAWIVLEPGAMAPSLEDLQARVRGELPVWCEPKAIHIVSFLPRSPLGDVERSRLVRGGVADGSGGSATI